MRKSAIEGLKTPSDLVTLDVAMSKIIKHQGGGLRLQKLTAVMVAVYQKQYYLMKRSAEPEAGIFICSIQMFESVLLHVTQGQEFDHFL